MPTDNFSFYQFHRVSTASIDKYIGQCRHYIKETQLASAQKKKITTSNITLQKVVIEKYQKKVLKNTRVKTRTVFYLQYKTSAQADSGININNITLIEVKDNNGKNYPVISIKTNGAGTLVVRAEKSPSLLDDAKSMQIILKAGMLDLKNPLTLSQRIVDFDEIDVDKFE